jgi:polysaccharide export outer membrane protein
MPRLVKAALSFERRTRCLRKVKGIPVRFFYSVFVLSAALAQQSNRPAAAPEVGANLPAQAAGFNDLIAVSVYDAPELSRTIRVGADGYIRLPMLKQRVRADGLYPSDLEAAIAVALRQEQILVDPFVTVTIAEYHSRPISVAGAVKMPLVFQAESSITLLEAVARAQGLREDAGREILVSRSQPGPEGKPIMLTRRVSVRGLIDDADPDLNLQLVGGEEIRVPEVSKIYVMGNVKKPGAYPVQDGSDTTIMQMLALAEGLMPFANRQAFIYRREAGGDKNEIPVALDKIMKRRSPDVTLTANDILYIPDNHGKRLGIAALEKVLMFGTAAGTAMIYAGR